MSEAAEYFVETAGTGWSVADVSHILKHTGHGEAILDASGDTLYLTLHEDEVDAIQAVLDGENAGLRLKKNE